MRLSGRQIFSHVGPNTLLSLRLVNKQFHAFLSAKSSNSIWKAARRRAKLPDIEDMTEMQYAELMFGKTCQVSRFVPVALAPRRLQGGLRAAADRDVTATKSARSITTYSCARISASAVVA